MDAMISFIQNDDVLCALILLIILLLSKFALTSKCIKSLNIVNNNQKIIAAFSSILVFMCGLSFIIMASVVKDHSVRCSIYAGLGSVLIFTIAYTIYSDIKLSSNLVSSVERILLEKLNLADVSKKYGFYNIVDFNKKRLLERIEKSKKCEYIVLYSLNFFEHHWESLEGHSQNNSISFFIINPDDSTSLESLEKSFEGKTKENIKESVLCAQSIICTKICKAQKLTNVNLSFVDSIITYSAYIFDDEELWFCPRHSAKGKNEGVVFEFKGNLEDNIFFKDAKKLISQSVKYCEQCPHGSCSE